MPHQPGGFLNLVFRKQHCADAAGRNVGGEASQQRTAPGHASSLWRDADDRTANKTCRCKFVVGGDGLRSVCCAGWPVIRLVEAPGGVRVMKCLAGAKCPVGRPRLEPLPEGLLPACWPGTRDRGGGVVLLILMLLELGSKPHCRRVLRRGHGRSSRSGDHHSAPAPVK